MKTLRLLALGAARSTVLFAATSAGAATTIGSKCAANTGAPITLFTTTTSSGESYVVPSNGVLTEWGTNHTAVGNDQVISAVLGGPTGPNWLIAANAPNAFVGANTSPTFAVRIPVTAGQTLGSATSTAIGTPAMCSTANPADTGVYAGPVGIGVPFSTTSITSNKAAIWATI